MPMVFHHDKFLARGEAVRRKLVDIMFEIIRGNRVVYFWCA
ncbi:hypothetical protein ABID23_001519 [Bartonella silvatica]|uniref:Uncharacterized protein n=1 Tax=Bartonella silvatica TaxID=357760 RepID=A0ABV2HIM4_9HYPH